MGVRAVKPHTTSLQTVTHDTPLGFMNPLTYMSDEQITALATLVRRTGLELSARAIEARTLTFGDNCHLDGTVALLMLMVTDHVVEVWHDDCAKALRELARALAQMAPDGTTNLPVFPDQCAEFAPLDDRYAPAGPRRCVTCSRAEQTHAKHHFDEADERVDVYIGPEPTSTAAWVVYHVNRTRKDGDHD